MSRGESHYKGLWVSATQRLSRGLQFDASYTLSKSRDTNSLSENVIRVQNSFDIGADLAPSDYDARHRFVINTIYQLPFSGNALVEGWQVGGIVQAQTGNPVNIVSNITTFNGVVNTLRPDLIGTLDVIGGRNQWFDNTACDPRIAGSCTASSVFAIPASPDGTLHFGNLPRNAVYGPASGMSIFQSPRTRRSAAPVACSCGLKSSICSIPRTTDSRAAS